MPVVSDRCEHLARVDGGHVVQRSEFVVMVMLVATLALGAKVACVARQARANDPHMRSAAPFAATKNKMTSAGFDNGMLHRR